MIWGLFAHEMKKNLKDKGLIFWMIVLPVVFIVIFGFIFGNDGETTFHVYYVDEDQTAFSSQLIESLSAADSFEFQALQDAEWAAAELEDGDIYAYFVIPKGFAERVQNGETNVISFHYNALENDRVSPIRTLLENVTYAFQEQLLKQTLSDQPELLAQLLTPALQIEEIALQKEEEIDVISHIVPGYTVMFTFYIIISMVISCVKDLEGGITARLASTSMKGRHYLFGKWLPYVIIVLVQIAILFGFGWLVYDINLGNPLALLLICTALANIATAWGMAISLLVKNENMGIGVTQVIALGGAMLGGLWMPIEFMPKFIQNIAPFLPQYWAQQGLLEIMVYGGGIGDIWLHVLILLGFGAAGLLAAVWSYPRFLASARS